MTQKPDTLYIVPRDVIDTPAADVLVLDRKTAATTTMGVPYIVISITNIGSQEAVLAESPLRLGVLRMQFRDTERAAGFTEVQAEAAVRFVQEHADALRGIVVHCEFGISRSAGLAAGLAEAMNGAPDVRFDDWYDCNERVRKLVRDAARRCGLWDETAMLRAQGVWQP